MKTRLLILAVLLMASTARAQDTPYAGMQTRDIKALSADRITGLLAGAGLGYAMAAELNGYPGPKHVLELAEQLALTDDQRKATETLFLQMQQVAMAAGKEVIDLETELDALFASGNVDAAKIGELTALIGAKEAELRAIHLATHLEMKPILTMHQQHLYQQLRGYDGQEMDHGAGGHDH